MYNIQLLLLTLELVRKQQLLCKPPIRFVAKSSWKNEVQAIADKLREEVKEEIAQLRTVNSGCKGIRFAFIYPFYLLLPAN